MARKPAPAATAVTVPFNSDVHAADAAAANGLAVVSAGMSADRDLLHQVLGQAQMAGAFAQFSGLVMTSKLAFVKENKLYQQLTGIKTPDGQESSRGTWEEFCALLGRSVAQVDEDIRNFKVFGEQALESMTRIGIGYRELRQFRRLPEEKRGLIAEMAAAGDKEGLRDLAEDLAAELKKAKGEVEELAADKAATQQVLDRKNALIDKLEMKVTSFETAPPDEQYAVLSDKALGVMRTARAQIDGLLRQACMHLKAHGDDRRAHDAFLSGLIAELEHALGALREEFSLPVPDDKALRPWEKEADRVRREQQAARAGKQ